jgi:alkylation response protein AidB-like acyl-CoA dehydrogenase
MSLLTPEQLKIQQEAREFVAEYIIPVAAEWDRKGEFHEFILPLAKKHNYFACGVPKQFGGLFFTPMVEGGIGAFGLTEPGAGSDVGAGSTRAVKDGDSYVINGTKCFITNGGYASVYLVIASTDPAKGAKGLSAFIVTRGTPGLTVGDEMHKLGIRSSNTVELVFKNARVPASHRVGAEGEGMKVAMGTLEMARPAIVALAVGLAQRTLDECVRYLHVKYPPAQKVFPPQWVQFKLADMEIQIQSARQLLYHAFELRDAGCPYSKESSIAKAMCGDTGMRVTRDALEILGSYGYSGECEVGKWARDAKIMQIYEGTNEIQRLVVGRALLATPARKEVAGDHSKNVRGAA